MFDQIKTEPLHFYQSSCPTQITAQINPQQQQHQVTTVLQQNQHQSQQNATVITMSDGKDNLQTNVSDEEKCFKHVCQCCFHYFLQQHADSLMPTLVDQIKPEIMNAMPQHIIHQSNTENTTTQALSSPRGSKPQACKVCGKVLSSASSYYVHMKLHSGTKPFQCKSFYK